MMKTNLQRFRRAPVFWIAVVAIAVLLLTNLVAAVIDAIPSLLDAR